MDWKNSLTLDHPDLSKRVNAQASSREFGSQGPILAQGKKAVVSFYIHQHRQRSALVHLSSVLFLSLLLLYVPLTWAQSIRPAKQTASPFSRYAASLAVVPETQTRRFYFRQEMTLSFARNSGWTEPRLRFTSCCVGNGPVFSTSRSVVDASAKANYLIGNASTRWLVKLPNNTAHWTIYNRDLQYYAQRVPLIGQTILRIAGQADSHPRAFRVARLLVNHLAPRF